MKLPVSEFPYRCLQAILLGTAALLFGCSSQVPSDYSFKSAPAEAALVLIGLPPTEGHHSYGFSITSFDPKNNWPIIENYGLSAKRVNKRDVIANNEFALIEVKSGYYFIGASTMRNMMHNYKSYFYDRAITFYAKAGIINYIGDTKLSWPDGIYMTKGNLKAAQSFLDSFNSELGVYKIQITPTTTKKIYSTKEIRKLKKQTKTNN